MKIYANIATNIRQRITFFVYENFIKNVLFACFQALCYHLCSDIFFFLVGQVEVGDDVTLTEDNESLTGTITNPKEDHSINPSDMKSKKEKRAERESRVYTVATDKLIKNLMTEYKKRKQQHSMPNFVKAGKGLNTKSNAAQVFKQREPVDYEIEKQQKVSIMKVSIRVLQFKLCILVYDIQF